MKQIMLYTDGACSYNPGPGGWGAILEFKGIEKEISGFEPETTNNRMELTAVIQGLMILKEPCEVTIHTDSSYVLNGFEKGWIYNWQRNGWKNSKKQPVENQDLWKMLIDQSKIHKLTWVKVKGHSGHHYNERVDTLARNQVEKNIKK